MLNEAIWRQLIAQTIFSCFCLKSRAFRTKSGWLKIYVIWENVVKVKIKKKGKLSKTFMAVVFLAQNHIWKFINIYCSQSILINTMLKFW